MWFDVWWRHFSFIQCPTHFFGNTLIRAHRNSPQGPFGTIFMVPLKPLRLRSTLNHKNFRHCYYSAVLPVTPLFCKLEIFVRNCDFVRKRGLVRRCEIRSETMIWSETAFFAEIFVPIWAFRKSTEIGRNFKTRVVSLICVCFRSEIIFENWFFDWKFRIQIWDFWTNDTDW